MSVKKRRILIVGGLAAGPSAAAKAVRTNPSAEVVMFESTETVSYGICEAPYAISGLIEDESRLQTYTPERLAQEKGISVKTLHLVEKISQFAVVDPDDLRLIAQIGKQRCQRRKQESNR